MIELIGQARRQLEYGAQRTQLWLGAFSAPASIPTTLDRYGDLMRDAHAAEARKLDRLVFDENGRVTSTTDRVEKGSV